MSGARGMPVRGEARFDAGSPAEARLLAAALAADDAAIAPCRAEGSQVVVQFTSGSALGLLRSLDDVVECLRAARPPPAAGAGPVGRPAPKESR